MVQNHSSFSLLPSQSTSSLLTNSLRYIFIVNSPVLVKKLNVIIIKSTPILCASDLADHPPFYLASTVSIVSTKISRMTECSTVMHSLKKNTAVFGDTPNM